MSLDASTALTGVGGRRFASRIDALGRLDIAWLCLFLGLIGALPLAILTPPLQVPDEAQHFSRAYQLSELSLFGEARDGRIGAELPASLSRLYLRFLGDDRPHGERNVRAQPLAATMAELAMPLVPGDRVFIDFTGAAAYSPLPYLPQVVAIALGRFLGLGPLALLYGARLFNILASIAVLAAAVRLAPRAKCALMVAGLVPMALYEDASLSPDALVIAGAFLYVALAMRAQAMGGWSRRNIFAAIAAGCVVCSLKPTYVPILLSGLVPCVFDRGRRGAALASYAIIVTAVLLVTCIWFKAASSSFVLARPGTGLREQLAWILAHPADYIDVLVRTLADKASLYFRSTIGVFGWMKIAPPWLFYVLPCAAIIIALVGDDETEPQVPLSASTWQIALVITSAALVVTALYLMWTPIGSPLVEGVQGRYFLPLAALACSALAPLARYARPVLRLRASSLCAAMLLVQAGLTDLVIATSYAVV